MALWVVRSESCCSLPSSLLLYARSLREKAIYNKLSYCIPQINLTVLKATVKVYSGACDSKTLSFHCCLIKVASEEYMCLASQTSFWTRNTSSWSYLLLFSVLPFYLVVICLLSFCLPDALLPFAVVYNVLVDQFTVFCKGVSCSQHWGWWFVRWKAFSLLISNVVVNHIAGSVEAVAGKPLRLAASCTTKRLEGCWGLLEIVVNRFWLCLLTWLVLTISSGIWWVSLPEFLSPTIEEDYWQSGSRSSWGRCQHSKAEVSAVLWPVSHQLFQHSSVLIQHSSVLTQHLGFDVNGISSPPSLAPSLPPSLPPFTIYSCFLFFSCRYQNISIREWAVERCRDNFHR